MDNRSEIEKGKLRMENESENYYCPVCKSKLEVESGCGSVSYFCNKCNKLISSSKILTEK